MGLVVNTSVLIAAAKELVHHHDSNWLIDKGGYLELSTHWAKGRLRKLRFSKKSVTTKACLTLVDFEECKSKFVFNANAITRSNGLPLFLYGTFFTTISLPSSFLICKSS